MDNSSICVVINLWTIESIDLYKYRLDCPLFPNLFETCLPTYRPMFFDGLVQIKIEKSKKKSIFDAKFYIVFSDFFDFYSLK